VSSVVVRHFISSKRRPHFKKHKSWERKKLQSWVPRVLETKNDCPGEAQHKFAGFDWNELERENIARVVTRK
jgi:hypothetical protein